MTAQEIIQLARTQTFTPVANLSDAQGLVYANLVYRRLVDKINQNVGEDHFGDFFYLNATAGQSEYNIPKKSASQFGCSMIDRIAINQQKNGVDDWIMMKPASMKLLPNDLERYKIKQPANNPFFVIFDTGIFICPTPSATLTGGIKVYGAIDVLDMALSDSPTIDSKWHDVISLGLEEYIYKSQGKKADAEQANVSFITRVNDILNQHQNRYMGPVYREMPNLGALMGGNGGYQSFPQAGNPIGNL